MTVLDWFFRSQSRGVPPISSVLPRVARVFISSTFEDMQLERNILARAVFPRLRDRINLDGISLYEVDLRWGISQEDAENRKVVSICLEEIDTCYPFFLCVLGERYGWRPSSTDIGSSDKANLRIRGSNSPSITEIEILHALTRASLSESGGGRPIFMFRARRFSAELGAACDEPDAMESLKNLVRRNVEGPVVEYGDLEEFEAQAEALLEDALHAWKSSGSACSNRKSTWNLERPVLMSVLRRACASTQPVMLTGASNSGLSSVGKTWVEEAGDRGILIDGRELRQDGLGRTTQNSGSGFDQTRASRGLTLSPDDRVEHAISSLRQAGGAKGRIFFDHFEECFVSDSQADLSGLPLSLPKGIEVLVSSRSPRLLAAAKHQGMNIVEVPGLVPGECAAFVEGMLNLFGKRLEVEQVERIAKAAFAPRVGALVVCLDELRRYGQFDSLDERLGELVACASDDELVQCVLEGVRGSVPEQFCTALDRVLIALFMSLRGLSEDELTHAATAVGGDRLPSLVWSTLRIGLGRALQWRGARIDLASGAVRRFAEGLVVQAPELAQQVGAMLLDHLANSNSERWVEEAPQIIFLTDGECGLARHLSKVKKMVQLLAFAKTYAAGCLERLSPEWRMWTCNKWLESIQDAEAACGTAWDLGNLAAQVGAAEAARRLFEVDAGVNQNRPNRQVLEVLALKSAARPETLAGIKLWRIPDMDGRGIQTALSREKRVQIWTEAATVLGLLAEGLVCEEPRRQDAWCRIAVESAEALRDDGALAQAHHLAGQLQLGLARWKHAASSFDKAIYHARRCGNACRLAQALERGATTALELSRFKEARSRAFECLSIARQCNLFEQECLGFERLIEVERRRANWDVAFEWARLYLERTQQAQIHMDRAEVCLSSLDESP